MAILSEIEKVIRVAFDAKLSPIIWGPPGVGKSQSVHQIAARSQYSISIDGLVRLGPVLLAEGDNLKAPSWARAAYMWRDGLDGIREVRAVNVSLSDNWSWEGITHVQYSDALPQLLSVAGPQTGRRVCDVRLVLCNPTDLKGIPVYSQDDGKAVWVMTGMFPASADKVIDLSRRLSSDLTPTKRAAVSDELVAALKDQHAIVFLDEITQAPPTVQAAAFSLVLDRRIGEYVLPESVNVVAASNRMTDQAATSKMPTPLKSRFLHLEIDRPNFTEWEAWAELAGPGELAKIDETIMAYLKFNQEAFFTFDPKRNGGDSNESTYACPRTWEFVSRALASMRNIGMTDPNIEQLTIQSCIGPGQAAAFCAWRDLYFKLPPPADVLSGKRTRKDYAFERIVERDGKASVMQNDTSLEYAFINSMATIMLSSKEPLTDKQLENFCTFLLDKKTTVEIRTTVTYRIINAQRKNDPLYSRNMARIIGFKPFREMIIGLKDSGVFSTS